MKEMIKEGNARPLVEMCFAVADGMLAERRGPNSWEDVRPVEDDDA